MEEKVFFYPGDVVILAKLKEQSPEMLVIGKDVRRSFKKDASDNGFFKGIKCIWFSIDGKLQEGIFNTKDLEKIR